MVSILASLSLPSLSVLAKQNGTFFKVNDDFESVFFLERFGGASRTAFELNYQPPY